MTRINCIPVSELTDKHLIAEYRELPRVFKLARHTPVPPEYTLGTGHVKFFYNKLLFCIKRQSDLVAEMKRRGFKPNFNPRDLWTHYIDANIELWNDWEPTENAMEINRARIRDRLDKSLVKS